MESTQVASRSLGCALNWSGERICILCNGDIEWEYQAIQSRDMNFLLFDPRWGCQGSHAGNQHVFVHKIAVVTAQGGAEVSKIGNL